MQKILYLESWSSITLAKYLPFSQLHCKNGKYLASITDDWVITCHEIIEETKTVLINFNERKGTCKAKKLHVLIAFH